MLNEACDKRKETNLQFTKEANEEWAGGREREGGRYKRVIERKKERQRQREMDNCISSDG